MHNKYPIRLRCAVLALCLSIAATFAGVPYDNGVSAADYVTMSIEKTTLGQGYLLEPTVVELQAGDTVATLLDRVLQEKGIHYKKTGNIAGANFYLQAVADPSASVIYVPLFIVKEMAKTEKVIDARSDTAFLGEFDYSHQAGWMFCVNNAYKHVGAAQVSLEKGDVIRWQFTLYGLGADVGSTLMGASYLAKVANKDQLVAKVAEANQLPTVNAIKQSNAYQSAMNVLQNLEIDQAVVDQTCRDLSIYLTTGEDSSYLIENTMATERLQPRDDLTKYVSVTGVTLDKTALSLAEGASDTLTATVSPKDAPNKNVTWRSDDPSIASVNGDGNVTAHKAGITTITATTEIGQFTAFCQVTVTEESSVAVTGISLDRTTLTLLIGAKETLVPTVQPADATNTGVRWRSSNNEIASVDETGAIEALSLGNAVITVESVDGGYTATCTINVVPPGDDGQILSVGAGGRVSPRDLTRLMGKEVSFYITPDEGYRVADVSLAGESVGAVTRFTCFVTNNTRIIVTFSKIEGVYFNDIQGHWAKEAIEQLATRGLLEGKGDHLFDPEGNITRAEFATLMARLSQDDLTQYGQNHPFQDTAHHWAQPSIDWARQNQIVFGKTDQLFAPDDNIIRQEMAVIINRYASYKSITMPEPSGTAVFTDHHFIAPWALNAVNVMHASHIITGYEVEENTYEFRPESAATRAEAATIVVRFLAIKAGVA